MPELMRSVITEIGPDVAGLLEGGVLILFAAGAPPELAEVSVLHAVEGVPAASPPSPGAALCIGTLATPLTGIGALAWAKLHDLGHVVVNFNGQTAPERPGELCAAPVDSAALAAALHPGSAIVIRS